jgi:hypothetical protein
MANIQSGATPDLLTIDPTSKAARATLYDAAGNPIALANGADARTSRGLLVAYANDGNARLGRADRFGSQAVALVTPLMSEPFEGATLSANRLLATATTMAAAQTALGFTINSGNITTINTGYLLSTRKHFPRVMRAPLQFKARARLSYQANSVMELGFGGGNTATASPTVGAYFQVTAAGVVQPVLTYNTVDVTGPAISGIDRNNFYTFDVLLDDDGATFVVQDTATSLILYEQSLLLPLTQGRLSNVTHLPAFFAVRNTGVAPATAPFLIATDWFVGVLDTVLNSPWPHRSAQMGLGSNYNPTTFAQAAQGANSAAPANGTLGNGAASYTTLGGRFSFVAVGGLATDYCLFGFTVPSPYQFVCTGVDVETYNTGAAVATTPTLLDWSIGVNGASANLGTGAHIRDFIGAQSFPVAAAIGAKADRVSAKYDAPLVCEAGLNLAIILRMPIATATASQVLQGCVKVHGYFE